MNVFVYLMVANSSFTPIFLHFHSYLANKFSLYLAHMPACHHNKWSIKWMLMLRNLHKHKRRFVISSLIANLDISTLMKCSWHKITFYTTPFCGATQTWYRSFTPLSLYALFECFKPFTSCNRKKYVQLPSQ